MHPDMIKWYRDEERGWLAFWATVLGAPIIVTSIIIGLQAAG